MGGIWEPQGGYGLIFVGCGDPMGEWGHLGAYGTPNGIWGPLRVMGTIKGTWGPIKRYGVFWGANGSP